MKLPIQHGQGAHITFVGDRPRLTKLVESLRDATFELDAWMDSGEFRLLSVQESYLLSGVFSGSRAAAFVESTILHAKSLGFERSLFVGWSDWVHELTNLGQKQLVREVVDYERALDSLINRYPNATILCPYTAASLESEILVELAGYHTEIQFPSPRVYARAG